MPIWLRKFTYKKIEEHYKKANNQNEDFMETTEKFKKSKQSGEWQPINPGNLKQFQFKKGSKSHYTPKKKYL